MAEGAPRPAPSVVATATPPAPETVAAPAVSVELSIPPEPAAAPPVAAPPPATSGAVLVLVLSVAAALATSFMCSLSEAVLLSVSRSHAEAMAKGASRAGRILRRWKRSGIELPISAILIVSTGAHIIGATWAGASYALISPATIWIFSIGFTVALLVFSEIIPKTLGVAFAHRLAGPVTLAVRVLTFVFHWPLRASGRMSRLLAGARRKPVTSIEEIRLLAALGRREGDVGSRVADLIEGAASLRDLTVRDVMVPRGGVVLLSGDRSLEENLDTIRESGHSRFPFTPTGEIDDVDGIVMAKELLFLGHDRPGSEVDWQKLKHALLVVPEGKPLDQVLRLFQDQRRHLAVVVDEYGGTNGVVTLEDVIEEIVGDIEDETDRVEQLIVKRQDGVLACRGRAEMRKLLRALGIDEKVEVVTVAGFVAAELRRVPVRGDVVEWQGLRFEVVMASRRRAERIEVRAR